ncbi:MAG: thiamine biosynthesis protein ThiS [Phycisphaeraceae bacterium]|nr:MAG: thiamine biosynthesis protein ThiS [Phycisphaeraceae bacterium]
MHVTVNAEPREVAPGTTVGDLLVELKLDKAICAAEINKAVVPRAERDARVLAEGDVIELVTLVGGG